jgi:acyl dehydratase
MDKSAIGRSGQPVTMIVELGKVREFARAIKDDNPIYSDETLARREAGGIMAPPTFLMTLGFWDDGRGRPKLDMDLRRVLHGEQEFEYLKPIHVGDALTAVSKIENVFEKAGSRGGTMSFGVTATEYRNQKGELVAISRSTVIETGQVVKKD